MAHHNFEKGDLVRLKTGTAKIIVTRVGGDSICGFYPTPEGPRHPFTWRKADDFIRFEEPEEPTTMAEALFALKSDPTIMGRVIGTNSEGKKVFEVRPTNELRVIPSDELEEVRPHTVKIDGCHYETRKDAFTKGDVLLMPSGDLLVVEAIDTKSRSPGNLPSGIRRVVTEPLAL